VRARAGVVVDPTCKLTSPSATKFKYHWGCLAAPPTEATTTKLPPSRP
jgi:hypothetical protein